MVVRSGALVVPDDCRHSDDYLIVNCESLGDFNAWNAA